MRDEEYRDLYKVVCSDITDCSVEAALISHKITSMRVRSQPQILWCFYLSYYVSNFVPRFINHAMYALEYFIMFRAPGGFLTRALFESYEIFVATIIKTKSVVNWDTKIDQIINGATGRQSYKTKGRNASSILGTAVTGT